MAALKTNESYEQMKNLLSSTVTLLCKNGIPFTQKLHVEALVGVTVDTNDVFFVHISETIPSGDQPGSRGTSPVHYSSDDQNKSLDSRMGRTSMKKEVYQRPGPLSSKRNHSPLHAGRSGSPAIGRQRNGTQHQMRRNLSYDYMSSDIPNQPQKVSHDVEVIPNPSPKLAAVCETDDVVLIKEERLRMPDSVAKPATMVAGQRRAPRPLSPSGVTVIEPDASVDDTQAMQLGYIITPNNKPNLKDTAVNSGPPAKRQCTDSNNSSNSSFRSDRSPTDNNLNSSSTGPYFAGQWSIGEPSPLPPHPVTYSEPTSRTIQAFPSCSSWTPPSKKDLNPSQDTTPHSASSTLMTRGFKNPRNNTMCQPVRDVLEFSLAQPVLAVAHEVSAFRLFWRGHDTIAGWQNIIYNRLELDAIVAEHPGVSFFISAITATARDPKTIVPTPTDSRLRAYPALGYWIVSRDGTFDRHTLMKKLSNAADGGELKTMLQNDGEKANETGALNLIVKDYGKGYVQQRVSESAEICCGPGEEHPTIRFILKEEYFEEKLREAVDLLSGVGCPVSLEKVDMETLTPEEEEEQGEEGQEGTKGRNEEKGNKEGNNFDDFVIHVVKDENCGADSELDVRSEPSSPNNETLQIEIVATESLCTDSSSKTETSVPAKVPKVLKSPEVETKDNSAETNIDEKLETKNDTTEPVTNSQTVAGADSESVVESSSTDAKDTDCTSATVECAKSPTLSLSKPSLAESCNTELDEPVPPGPQPTEPSPTEDLSKSDPVV